MKLKYPDMAGKEVAKQLGTDWQSMSDDERASYVVAAEKDKARWLKEKQVYDQKQQDRAE